MRAAARLQQGFTLIELVIVITVGAIVAVFMVFFLGTPIDAYFAQSSRANLVDSGDRVLRSVAGDVRTALPNSLRVTASGSVAALELLATNAVARYYGPGDKNYLTPAKEALEELAIGQPDTAFYTMTQFASLNGSYLAVDNQGSPGAYGFGGIMTPLPPAFTVTPDNATVEDHATFSGAGFDFANASPTNSIFLVSGPVSYLCDSNAQTVQRYSGYTIAAVQMATDAQLMAAGATRSLIAQNVSGCTLNVVAAPASAKYGQLLILEVTLANGSETLPVFQEAATEYLP